MGLYSWGDFGGDVADGLVGLGDGASFYRTNQFRDYMGDQWDTSSKAYYWGNVIGATVSSSIATYYGGAYLRTGLYYLGAKPDKLYHFMDKQTAQSVSEHCLKSGTDPTITGNKGVYATKWDNKYIAKLQGARKNEDRVVINNTDGYKPDGIIPGVYIKK